MKLDEKTKRFFLLLGKEEGISSGELLSNFDTMSNEEMMYEVCISYSKEGQRLDSSLIGFGESLQDKKYLLFIPV